MVLQAVWRPGCWVEYKQVGYQKEICALLPKQDKEYIQDITRWSSNAGGTWECVIGFLLLTVVPEKSAAERCWMVALTGYCCQETCRGQCSKYKQTFVHIGAFGPLKTSHKESTHQFQPPCFPCNRTSKHMAQWLDWFRIHWLEYIIPAAIFR